MKKKAIIISIKSTKLSKDEEKLFSKEKPWGVILFKRNIKNLSQIKRLIKNIKSLSKEPNFPILIDEEGSKVSRLRNIFDNNFSQNFFGSMYELNSKNGINLFKKYINRVTSHLKQIENTWKYLYTRI